VLVLQCDLHLWRHAYDHALHAAAPVRFVETGQRLWRSSIGRQCSHVRHLLLLLLDTSCLPPGMWPLLLSLPWVLLPLVKEGAAHMQALLLLLLPWQRR
jgi:hypothetical protein